MSHWKFDLDNIEHARVFLFLLKKMGREFAFTGQGESERSIIWAAKLLWKEEFKDSEAQA